MKNEIWKDVPGYEGYYAVSDQGRLKSLSRTITTKQGERKVKGSIRKLASTPNGYLIVVLSKGGHNKTRHVHKLVAEAFLGHTPCGHKEVVDHINEDRSDNRLENLRLTTQRENLTRNKKGKYSKYPGVSKYQDRWISQIFFDGTPYSIGYFDKEQQAANAYQEALFLYNSGFPGGEVVSYLKNSGRLEGSIHFNKYNTTSYNEDKGVWVSYITVGDQVVHLGEYAEESTARGVGAYFQLGRLASGSRTEEELITFMRSDTYADILNHINKFEWHTNI
jgi:hypothetical protein